MPSYKLTYFDIMGVAEPIRFILSYGEAEFVDDRCAKENWLKLKPEMPYGQLPILEVDGKVIHQSAAICRYLAKQFGLAGKDDWEALQIDATADTINDFRSKLGASHYESDPVLKETKYELLVKETIPYYLERLDAQVKQNNGWLVGGAVTWVDLLFIGFLEYMNAMARFDLFEKYENLSGLKSKVLALPQIKAWVAKRPVTDF